MGEEEKNVQVKNRTMAARTATQPLIMDMMTPAMALITVMMQSPMAWKQDTTAPMMAGVCW